MSGSFAVDTIVWSEKGLSITCSTLSECFMERSFREQLFCFEESTSRLTAERKPKFKATLSLLWTQTKSQCLAVDWRTSGWNTTVDILVDWSQSHTFISCTKSRNMCFTEECTNSFRETGFVYSSWRTCMFTLGLKYRMQISCQTCAKKFTQVPPINKAKRVDFSMPEDGTVLYSSTGEVCEIKSPWIEAHESWFEDGRRDPKDESKIQQKLSSDDSKDGEKVQQMGVSSASLTWSLATETLENQLEGTIQVHKHLFLDERYWRWRLSNYRQNGCWSREGTRGGLMN